MRRRLEGDISLDDDPARVDAVYRFLSEDAYWARGRSRDRAEELVRSASRVVGLYDGDRQVGFARAVTDGSSFVYLADVYVLPAYRRRGFGAELLREMVERGPHAHLRWLLHTEDAHGLYRKLGFGPPGRRLMERAGTSIPSR